MEWGNEEVEEEEEEEGEVEEEEEEEEEEGCRVPEQKVKCVCVFYGDTPDLSLWHKLYSTSKHFLLLY